MPKLVADMHIPPALRRWGVRFALAVLIAIAIGYVPSQVIRRDPRAARLEAQVAALTVEARALAIRTAALRREIEALRNDVGAIEDRARTDLGMAYPDDLVLRLAPQPQPGAPGSPEAR